ncbi:uncharacterized protein LOC112629869 [Theropithecus gelada]|uniref:uncharacterized protein LOC112629869 n=1 Tax=Theropithecus gelada TaxID=9565 RepID=UPI000DC1B776|nr:uncharacterized protein LOC112629869 [Theropithecus gelada]
MCVPSPEHTLRTLSTNRRGEGEAPPPAPCTYTPRRTRPAPARLTPGPYASVSAEGGGDAEARGRREEKTAGKSREEGRGGGGGGCVVGVGLGRRGGASAQAPRPGKRSSRCVASVGEGRAARGRSSGVSAEAAPPSAPPSPASTRRSVNPSPRRWAVQGASGFLRANHPPRARPLGVSSRRGRPGFSHPSSEGRRARVSGRGPLRARFPKRA